MTTIFLPQPHAIRDMPTPQELNQVCAALEQSVAARMARHTDLRAEELQCVSGFNQSTASVAEARVLRQCYDEAQASIQARVRASDELFREQWCEALEALDQLCKRVRAHQPFFSDLGAVLPPPASGMPDALVSGRVRIGYANWQGVVPRLLSFPFKQALRFAAGDEESLAMLRQLLLRLLISLPPGGLRVVACDPLRLGAALSDFLPLLGQPALFPDARVLSRAGDIENALSREFEQLEQIIQQRLGDTYEDWAAYNRRHPDAPLPFTVLIIQDSPAQLSGESMWYLERLLAEGPRCGVLTLISVREEEIKDQHKRLQDAVMRHAVPMMSLITPARGSAHLLNRTEEREPWPEADKLQLAVRALSERYRQSSTKGKDFAGLFETSGFWTGSTEQGIAVPVGWSDDGQLASFVLGSANHAYHALIAGRTGSGKSNFLHVLIHALCHGYSPDQVRLFLLDYKEGIEFSVYADPPLPHAALVAVQASAEYGLSVLRHLNDEMAHRGASFKAQGVTDLAGYRQAVDTPMPRLVMIVDEFQGLFAGDRQHVAEVESLLNRLLRQGRSFGIHLVLATQTLKGIDALQKSEFVSQIGMRVCLACTEDDSRIILGNSNLAGANLSGPPLAILNASQGERSANRLVQVPLAEMQARRERLAGFAVHAAQSNFSATTRVFDGMHRPLLPPPQDFRVLGCDGNLELLLGEQATFAALPWRCQLEARAGANLLLVGRDDQLRAQLLRALLHSLAGNPNLESLLYFDAADNGHDQTWFAELPADLSWRVERGDWDGNGGGFFEPPAKGRRKVLLIDTLDCTRFSLEQFKALLTDRVRQGIHVILLTAQCRGLPTLVLSAFERRLGFTLSDEEASSLLSPGIGQPRVQGLDAPHRALYADLGRGERVWLSPYGNAPDRSSIE